MGSKQIALVLAALALGYLLGSLWPLHGYDCHALGGHLEALPGPGKPTQCVIPWDNY